MKKIDLENKWAVRILFLTLLTYLVLRAIFLTPYVDEITTLFDYIESNFLFEETLTSSSANNHLLNTYLGKIMYFVFGDNFLFLRIPNILAFVLFFFSTKFIIRKSITKEYQFTVFLALNTVSWIFEYFGYLRGYGLALGFFFAAIALLYSWMENKKPLHFVLFIVLLYFSYFANLSFFNSLAILSFFAILFIVYHFKDFSKKHLIIYTTVFIFFWLAVLPLIQYSFDLKDAGALWWGNLSGLWECTGKSLTRLTFSTTNSWFQYLVAFLLLSSFALCLFSIYKKGFKQFVFSLEGIIFILLFGNLFLLEILAFFFEVNYPSDRAAMLLVLFTIYTISASIQHLRYVKNYIFLLLYFPFTFLLNMNIHSSIYQKNHRVSPSIQEYLSNNVTAETNYSIDPLLSQSLYYNLRNTESANLFHRIEYGNSFIQPYYLVADTINYTTPIPTFYKRVMFDKESELCIYKDTRKFKYTQVQDTLIKELISSKSYVELIRKTGIYTGKKSGKFKIKISGEIQFMEDPTALNLTITLGDSMNPSKHYSDFELKKIALEKNSVSFNWNSPVYQSQAELSNLLLYFWNINGKSIRYKNIHATFYKAEEIK